MSLSLHLDAVWLATSPDLHDLPFATGGGGRPEEGEGGAHQGQEEVASSVAAPSPSAGLPMERGSRDRVGLLASQQQPQQQQQQAGPQDCMQCRVIGSGVCLAASAYLAMNNYAQQPAGQVHRAVMLAAAGGFLALGIARALI